MFAPMDPLIAPSRLAELRVDPNPARRPVAERPTGPGIGSWSSWSADPRRVATAEAP